MRLMIARRPRAHTPQPRPHHPGRRAPAKPGLHPQWRWCHAPTSTQKGCRRSVPDRVQRSPMANAVEATPRTKSAPSSTSPIPQSRSAELTPSMQVVFGNFANVRPRAHWQMIASTNLNASKEIKRRRRVVGIMRNQACAPPRRSDRRDIHDECRYRPPLPRRGLHGQSQPRVSIRHRQRKGSFTCRQLTPWPNHKTRRLHGTLCAVRDCRRRQQVDDVGC